MVDHYRDAKESTATEQPPSLTVGGAVLLFAVIAIASWLGLVLVLAAMGAN